MSAPRTADRNVCPTNSPSFRSLTQLALRREASLSAVSSSAKNEGRERNPGRQPRMKHGTNTEAEESVEGTPLNKLFFRVCSVFHPWLFWIVVALGLGLRAFHYLSDPPVWHDEQ